MNLFRKKPVMKVESSNTVYWVGYTTTQNTCWDASSTLTEVSKPVPVNVFAGDDTIRIELSDGKLVPLKEYIESVIDERLRNRQ